MPGAGDVKDVSAAVRNTVRLCLSAKEYRVLYDIAVKRAPALRNKLPSSLRDDPAACARNRHSLAAVRASLRVFVGSSVALKLVEIIMSRVKGNALQYDNQPKQHWQYISNESCYRKKPRTPLIRSPNFRLSFSLSLLLLLHRLLYRFLVRLRANLGTDDARSFRERNPRVSRALTSQYAPAIGASLAGFALGVAPQDQLRLTAAIWTSTRSLEYLFNAMDSKGWLDGRPWWFGSWLLMPISCAQLFHAFVFDRETTPGVR